MIDSTSANELIFSTNDIQLPRAIVFDWDNTLVDSWESIHDAQNHTLLSFGLRPWTLEETRQRVRGSMRDTFPKLFGEKWREAGEIFYRRFTERHMCSLRPLAGAEEMLRMLFQRGIYLAVVSNKKGDYLRKEVAYLGWNDLFSRIVGAFDAARDKPAADPVVMALENSGIEPTDGVWLAGDADIDLECAVNAGCVPILMRKTPPELGEFKLHPPAIYIDGCITLSKVLQKM